jgi:hydroxymethylpyrimidine pyrophosphatase-like HAD family hydrolase
MKRNIICDLDGTIALDDHRAHLIQADPENRKWDEYFSLCDGDTPNEAVIDLLRKLGDHRIYLLSARSANVREKTEHWLDNNRVPYDLLMLRYEYDRTDDNVLKITWASTLGLTPKNTLFVLEDRQRVVDAWRAAGFTCFQVAPGKF